MPVITFYALFPLNCFLNGGDICKWIKGIVYEILVM